ncbi:MAG: hypothetical protein L0241_31560 [Planctomycetia bacterium]|nr:hypothetical protein [Planctomycetia bacterium]
MEEVVVVNFPAEGESCSVVGRKTAEGWHFRWVYSSIWDDVDAELLGIIPRSESAEATSITEVLPEGWIKMRPGGIHPDWLMWFRGAVADAIAVLGDKEEKRKARLRWRGVLAGGSVL